MKYFSFPLFSSFARRPSNSSCIPSSPPSSHRYSRNSSRSSCRTCSVRPQGYNFGHQASSSRSLDPTASSYRRSCGLLSRNFRSSCSTASRAHRDCDAPHGNTGRRYHWSSPDTRAAPAAANSSTSARGAASPGLCPTAKPA